jgi:hypothetical protein
LEIRAAEKLHQSTFGVRDIYALDQFDAWLKDFFARMTALVQKWANGHINGLELMSSNTQIQALIPQLRATVNAMQISQTNFYPVLP